MSTINKFDVIDDFSPHTNTIRALLKTAVEIRFMRITTVNLAYNDNTHLNAPQSLLPRTDPTLPHGMQCLVIDAQVQALVRHREGEGDGAVCLSHVRSENNNKMQYLRNRTSGHKHHKTDRFQKTKKKSDSEIGSCFAKPPHLREKKTVTIAVYTPRERYTPTGKMSKRDVLFKRTREPPINDRR